MAGADNSIPTDHSQLTLGMDYDAASTASLISESMEEPVHEIPNYNTIARSDTPQSGNRDLSSPATVDSAQSGQSRPGRKFTVVHQESPTTRFYHSQTSDAQSQADDLSVSYDARGLQRENVQQSRRLPKQVWRFLAIILGIKREENERTVVAIILFTITVFFACVFCGSGVVYTVYDIKSSYSKTTVLIGSVSLFLGFGWICLGIYSHRLAARLLSNRNFAESVRIHTRTFFKISAAGLLAVCAVAMVVTNSYGAFDHYEGSPCRNIDLFPFVCQVMYISRVGFTIIAMTWNLLVGLVLLSVCRTHTIGIRRFIRELEEDSKVYEEFWKESLHKVHRFERSYTDVGNEEWFVWSDNHTYNYEDMSSSQSPSGASAMGNSFNRNSLTQENDHIPRGDNPEANYVAANINTSPGDLQTVAGDVGMDTASACSGVPLIMSPDEILLSYWKISNRMRITSLCLQRWLASWLAFILFWCGDYVIFWIGHPATILGILEFVLPVLLCLLLCAAYAEANGEGQRMIRCICPTRERFGLLFFLNQQPLQMKVFGFSISYQAILGVILAFSVAFASRIIMDEVLK